MKITALFFGLILLVSCKKEGCTDETAINFNSNVNKDNGSCFYGPVLTILGNSDTIIQLNSTYVDPGATAINKDGTSATLTVENPVNTAVIGIYLVKYTAVNTNQTIEKTRKVTVLANIGETYQGGIFFYYFQPNDVGYVDGEIHGLLCANSDQSTNASWGCQGTSISTNDGIGTGNINTNEISSQCNEMNTAANVCANLVLNGYDDWFLPSRKELQQMYTKLHLPGFGNFSVVAGNNFYWSSSQFNNASAWYRSFDTNNETSGSKTGSFRVRAIRKF
jgi:hypothetical protein